MNHFKKRNNKLEKLRGIFFQLGLIVAGGLTLLAFEWTTLYKISELEGIVIDDISSDFEYIPTFEKEEKKVKKIKPPKVDLSKIKMVDNDYKEPIEELTEEAKKEESGTFDEGKWESVEEVKEETPLSLAQHMPHYEKCASLSEDEKKQCTQEEMYKHFGKKMRIPEHIKMQGKATYLAFVYFEINKNGEITNVKILNDEEHKIPRELEREAYNAVSSLPQLIPAKNHGKKVKVLYKIPIKFKVK